MIPQMDVGLCLNADPVGSGAEAIGRQSTRDCIAASTRHDAFRNQGVQMDVKLVGFILSIFALGAFAQAPAELNSVAGPEMASKDKPMQSVLQRAASRRFDLRSLPQTPPVAREPVELE